MESQATFLEGAKGEVAARLFASRPIFTAKPPDPAELLFVIRHEHRSERQGVGSVDERLKALKSERPAGDA